MTYHAELLSAIQTRTAVLGVIGLGYVGLPLAVTKASAGYRVIGFDLDQKKISSIESCSSYIADVSDQEISEQVMAGRLSVTSNFDKLKEVDAVSICVPTPIDAYKQPDLQLLLAAVNSVVEHMPERLLVILSSTTFPGTTEEVVRPLFAKKGYQVGKQLFLAYSPERIDPGNRSFQIRGIPRVVGGVTTACTELASQLYGQVLNEKLFEVDHPSIAEMTKIVENTFRLVNIGLMNELAVLCHRMELDIWKVIEAASTKPYGFLPFYPGPGIGGHCIPVDPYYLTWKAKAFNFSAELIEKAASINESMPEYVIYRMTIILNQLSKPLKNAKICLIGIAYKKNVSDLRESPVLEIIQRLEQYGANWSFHDPRVLRLERGNREVSSVPLEKRMLQEQDLVVITTDHDEIDYPFIAEYSPVIFDTRNRLNSRICKGIHLKL